MLIVLYGEKKILFLAKLLNHGLSGAMVLVVRRQSKETLIGEN